VGRGASNAPPESLRMRRPGCVMKRWARKAALSSLRSCDVAAVLFTGCSLRCTPGGCHAATSWGDGSITRLAIVRIALKAASAVSTRSQTFQLGDLPTEGRKLMGCRGVRQRPRVSDWQWPALHRLALQTPYQLSALGFQLSRLRYLETGRLAPFSGTYVYRSSRPRRSNGVAQ